MMDKPFRTKRRKFIDLRNHLLRYLETEGNLWVTNVSGADGRYIYKKIPKGGIRASLQ